MVKSLLSLLSARQNSILSGAFVLMVTVFASRFLGLIRNRLLVHNFDTTQTDIFLGAFKLPDLLFQLLIFGTLSVAFIPTFTEIVSKKGDEEAFDFASKVLNLSMLLFAVLAVVCFIFVDQFNSILLPGFDGARKELANQLTRVILFSEILLVVGSFFIGIANSYQRFIFSALAPLFYNLGIILGIGILSQYWGLFGPAIGTVIGAALHVLIQIPVIKSLGYKYTFSFDFFNSGVRDLFRLMSIRNIGLVAEQINDAVGVALASLVSASSITLLTFAQQLQAVPIGLFGATIAQAALPVLSRETASQEKGLFRYTLLTTMHQILFLTLPAAAILIVLRIPVVRLVFGASQFDWADTVLTGRTVAMFSVGLVAQSIVLLLVRGFYALKDVRTPVIVSITSVFINISLSLIFVKGLGLDVWSLGLAYAVSMNFSMFALLFFLNREAGGFSKRALIVPAIKMLFAAVIAAIALYVPIKSLDQLVFDTTKTVNLIILTSIASAFGLFVYLLMVWVLKVKELMTFIELLKKVAAFQNKLRSPELPQDSTPV
jgi:putative peptidoglycan lipid II flippase